MGFNNPVALALDADGVEYVVNRGSESISKSREIARDPAKRISRSPWAASREKKSTWESATPAGRQAS